MQREEILERLREQGCRITKQRQLLLDIILQEDRVLLAVKPDYPCGLRSALPYLRRYSLGQLFERRGSVLVALRTAELSESVKIVFL